MSRKPYRRYPPGPSEGDRIWWLVLVVCLLLALTLFVRLTTGDAAAPQTVEGKPVGWWAAKAKQARKDANARAATVRRMRRTLAHDPGVREAIALATIVYPRFSEARAWAIILHESWMTRDPIHAVNSSSGAAGILQYLPSTFNSTPYRSLSIWSPYAQLMAAGYLHQLGQGCVHWKIGPQC